MKNKSKKWTGKQVRNEERVKRRDRGGEKVSERLVQYNIRSVNIKGK